LVIVTATETTTNGNAAFASFSVSGTTTIAASDNNAVSSVVNGGNQNPGSAVRASTEAVVNLTAGSNNVFTMAFRSGTTTAATFGTMTITVIPLN
jgi:hypothetical protein